MGFKNWRRQFVQAVLSVVIVSLTIACCVQLWSVGAWTAVYLSAISGTALVIGMRAGIAEAPAENWNRQPSMVQSVLLYLLFFAVVSIPAAITGFILGPISALSSLWLTLFVMAVTSRFVERLFGPISSFVKRQT